MNRTRINIAVLVSAVVVLLTVLAFRVRVGATADSVAVLKTSGMTCSSCSAKISKALESVKGVAATEVDVEGGWVIVGYDKKDVKAQNLMAMVNSIGYSSEVKVVLTPVQFKEMTGREIGAATVAGCGGCCGKKRGTDISDKERKG